MSEEYRKNKMKYVKGYLIIGLALIVIKFALYLLKINVGDFWFNMMSIFCIILIVMGLSRYTLLNNEKTLQYYKVNENDERNAVIRGKAGYLTFIFSVISLAIFGIVLIYLNYELISYVVIGLMLVEYLVFIILLKYYNSKL